MPDQQSELVELIRTRSESIPPRSPALPKAFRSLESCSLPRTPRAVLFDVYGTLFVSGSGDIGTSQMSGSFRAQTALRQVGIEPSDPSLAGRLADKFLEEIEQDHRRRRSGGSPHPEIEVRDIWRRVLDGFGLPSGEHHVSAFSLEYELAGNPVWPMPGVRATLQMLRGAVSLGIVSNAQFYTPLLFHALLHQPPEALGFDPAIVAYSYKHHIAKPDPALFDGPLAALAEQGIDSTEVVYVGNDMLNDVATATSRKCMSILFAGDARSLRLREDHPAVGVTMPDSVALSLEQVATIVLKPKEKP